MTRRPREQLLQMLVYEHYVRPHIDFFAIVSAERDLMDHFDEVPIGGTPCPQTTEAVRRCFDKAWRRAEREWVEFRGGEFAIFTPRHPKEEAAIATSDPAQLELPEATDRGPPLSVVAAGEPSSD